MGKPLANILLVQEDSVESGFNLHCRPYLNELITTTLLPDDLQVSLRSLIHSRPFPLPVSGNLWRRW